MKIYTIDELKAIIAEHVKWLKGEGGKRADLSYSNLRYSNLSGSNLSDSDLRYSDLSYSNLSDSNLSDSDLSGSNLRGSNLSDSDLSGSNLRGSDLSGSNLSGSNLSDSDLSYSNLRYSDLRGSNLRYSNLSDSNLRGSNLSDSDLRGSNLSGVKQDDKTVWPHFQICAGGLIGYKQVQGKIVTLFIPSEAKRTASVVGRKCRAEYVIVTDIEGGGPLISSAHGPATKYAIGKTVKPDSYDDNPMIECSNGIHFFQTRKEAEEFKP
jgi:hypothetical protein